MDIESHSTSLSCELRILKAKNIDTKSSSGGALFVRCYLSAGNNTRVKLNTKEISSSDHTITWNHTFSLDCLGTQESIKWLKQETLVFELRSRCIAPFIGRIRGSKLIGRAEIPWKRLVDSMNMEIEKWVLMIPQNGRRIIRDDVKFAAVQISVKIEESYDKVIISERKWDERSCGCMDGGCKSCVDYEFFAIEAALEQAL